MRNTKLMSLALAVLMGCGAARFQSTHPASTATTGAPADVFAKATRVLIERGESIETKDEAAGIIVTKWSEGTMFGNDKIRQRWSITVANESVTVTPQCQTQSGAGGIQTSGATDWKDCSDKQPGDRQTKAEQLANAIAH